MNKQTDFQRSPSGRYELMYRTDATEIWRPDFRWEGLTLNAVSYTYMKYQACDEQRIVPVENRDSND